MGTRTFKSTSAACIIFLSDTTELDDVKMLDGFIIIRLHRPKQLYPCYKANKKHTDNTRKDGKFLVTTLLIIVCERDI